MFTASMLCDVLTRATQSKTLEKLLHSLIFLGASELRSNNINDIHQYTCAGHDAWLSERENENERNSREENFLSAKSVSVELSRQLLLSRNPCVDFFLKFLKKSSYLNK